MPLGQNLTIGEVIPMRDVVRISVEVADGLRRSMSRNGIQQLADFVNGMAFAGILLQKNYRPEDGPVSFVDTFRKNVSSYTKMMLRPEYDESRREMMVHRIGVADMSPTEMLVTAGLSMQETISTIAEEYGLSAQDVMELVTIVIALAIAASTPEEKLDIVVSGMSEGITEKTKVWDQLIPSDDEMLGEDDEDY